MKKILSKWEWIECECKKLGYTKSAILARKIENALKELYGDTMTKDKMDLKDFQDSAIRTGVTVHLIRALATNESYCVACEDAMGCVACLFNKEYGGCRTGSRLYGKFLITLYHESGLIIEGKEK